MTETGVDLDRGRRYVDPVPDGIQIVLNGEVRRLDRSMTVAELLATLELRTERVAVEKNRLIVKRAEHATAQIADGDVIEVIHFVGGG